MVTASEVRTGRLPLGSQEVAKKLRFLALAVPALALLGSAALMALEPRFGLFGAALILGWTQLVGL